MSVNVSVNVNVNGRPATPPVFLAPQRPNAEGSTPHDGPSSAPGAGPGQRSKMFDLYSEDGWSWVGVQAVMPLSRRPHIYVECQARRKTWGNWIYDKGYEAKTITVTGHLRGADGREHGVEIVQRIMFDDYSTVIYLPEADRVLPMSIDLWVTKTGGYWNTSGPKSSRCGGPIKHSWSA